MFSTPKGAARLLLFTVTSLFALKVIVGVITGSISVWAQAVDSSLDIFAVIITFLTLGFSAKPADREHPFGHGKVEDIAAGIQAILLTVAAGSIVYSAIGRISSGETLNFTGAGIAVMAVSLLASIFLSRHLFKVAKASESVALEANANNILGDVYSTSGVLVGLTIVQFFPRLTMIDPILALAVSLLILRGAYRVGQIAWGGLVDVRLPREEEELVLSTIREHTSQLAGFHEVRSRKSGAQRFIDLHLLLPKDASVEEAHRMCDHLEEDIRSRLPNANVTIHVEPCNIQCKQCYVSSCNLRIETAIGYHKPGSR